MMKQGSSLAFEACIICNTYNQAPYIRDALDGFVSQQTTFPYICLIVDDASTDGEQGVIKEYLQEQFDIDDNSITQIDETDDFLLYFSRHLVNLNCFFAVYFLKYNHFSSSNNSRKHKYIAGFTDNVQFESFCEGDDYWISPTFLQMAISFLRDNKEYSAVFGNKIVCDNKGTVLSKTTFGKDLTIHDIMRGKNMGLRNLCFRREIHEVPPFVSSHRDLYIYYQCAVSGKLKYFNHDFAVYRLTGAGVHSGLDEKGMIYKSYLHYYEFHKKTDFTYQKEYVRYQLATMLRHAWKLSNIRYCCQLIKKFHVPSTMRYWWYIESFLEIIRERTVGRIKTI